MYRNYKITENMNENEKKKLEIIHKTYKAQRENINYEFNRYLKDKYLKFNTKTNFWTLFASLDNIVDLSGGKMCIKVY